MQGDTDFTLFQAAVALAYVELPPARAVDYSELEIADRGQQGQAGRNLLLPGPPFVLGEKCYVHLYIYVLRVAVCVNH
jgi:hypothetical protein